MGSWSSCWPVRVCPLIQHVILMCTHQKQVKRDTSMVLLWASEDHGTVQCCMG